MSRRGLAWGALAASLLTILLASTPFWLPRAVGLDGTSWVVSAGVWAFLLSGGVALALGLCALFLPNRVVGARDAWTILLASLALLPAAALLLLLLAVGSQNLDF